MDRKRNNTEMYWATEEPPVQQALGANRSLNTNRGLLTMSELITEPQVGQVDGVWNK